jgi:hypothetical protein
VPVDDEVALEQAVRDTLAMKTGPALRETVQTHATQRFALERLVDDLDRLYRGLLEERRGAGTLAFRIHRPPIRRRR